LVFHSDFPKKEEVDRYWNLTVGFSKDLNLISSGRLVSLFGYWIGLGFGFGLSFSWIPDFLYQSTSITKLIA
jgi:hypothetical protein